MQLRLYHSTVELRKLGVTITILGIFPIITSLNNTCLTDDMDL